MKPHLIRSLLGGCALLLGAQMHGAITGQWDFNTDLSATIGQPINPYEAQTEQGTEFNTTTGFGIPGINGQEARVMKFPKTSEYGGYYVPTGASANGGGFLVNQYSIIMDVLFPAGSSDKRRALWNFDLVEDAEFFIQANNGVGSGANSSGTIQPNTWHRIVLTADLSTTPATVDKYIDGVKVGSEQVEGLDSRYAIAHTIGMFADDTAESESGYINSLQIRDEKMNEGLIAALGGPKAEGILTGPPPNPYISSVSPSPDSVRIPTRSTVSPLPEVKIVIENGVSKVVDNSIVLKFDDAVVTPSITKDGNSTIVSYTHNVTLEPLSIHSVGITFQDDAVPANSLGTQFRFAVGPFTAVKEDAALAAGSGTNPGFKIRTVQAHKYIQQVNNPTNLPMTLPRAIQHINGTLRGINGELLVDQSNDKNTTFSWPTTINFHTEEFSVGAFENDQLFPGIPGTGNPQADPVEDPHSTQFTTEVLTYLALKEGIHRFGVSVNVSRVDVNDDDYYALFVGRNPRDFFSQMLRDYSRNFPEPFPENAVSHNEVTFYAPKDGLYPFRLLFAQGGRHASLEWYSVNIDTGEKILINDPANPDSIKAFQNTTAPGANIPYVAELSPRPGTLGNKASAPLEILIDDSSSRLDVNSLKLVFDGMTVTPSVTTTVPSTMITDKRTVITYQPNVTRTKITNEVQLTYSDNATPVNTIVRDWNFTITAERGQRTVVRGQWDFNQGDLSATVGRGLEFFDGPGGLTQQGTKFGTTTSFGLPNINGEPAMVMEVPPDDSNAIGYKMFHGIAPNGGGTRVNQYTLIMDVLLDTQNTGAPAASLLQVDSDNNTGDGDLFWQGDNFGQGQGGYVGTGHFTAGAWHRVSIAVDLTTTPGTITKYVDGIKQDDWRTDSLDGRRALREFAILFADGDADERRRLWINSVQVREGKLSDAQLAWLGGPSAGGIPLVIPETSVAGQWDFDRGNLAATAGRALEYFDGAEGLTQAGTKFGTTTSFGLPDIGGQPALVMEVPGDDSNAIGYKMFHGIAPNGGGTRVNQYTLIMDVLLDTQNTGAPAASLLQVDSDNNTGDGDLFWQGNNFGQGQGGYVGTGHFTAGEWHRVSIAVDLTSNPGTITKYVDGIKQDDWRTDSLDGRRALRDFAILFADGDADERRRLWVNSVQVREGKLSDAQLAWLGRPSAGGIPLVIPDTSVSAQWDFDRGNLSATAGRALEYFDGAGGQTEAGTKFGTSTSFGLPDINGQPALVMEVPGDDSNAIGYKMFHGIAPNGGGTRVNQYTLIMDVLLDTQNTGAPAASLLQVDSENNTGDGDLFWQGDNFGQGQGGYVGTGIFTLGQWHRVAIAVDLTTTPGTITKFVDGVKQDDWRTDSLDGRRALREFAILFADGDADERRRLWVNSVQVHSRKLSDAELVALGGPTAEGLPLTLPPVAEEEEPFLMVTRGANGVTISWPESAQGFVLEGTGALGSGNWVAVSGVVNNSVTIQASEAQRFYRLKK